MKRLLCILTVLCLLLGLTPVSAAGAGPAKAAALPFRQTVAASSTAHHMLAIMEDGSVYTWGSLGDKDAALPEPVAEITGAVSVAAEQDLSFVVTKDGTLWDWSTGGWSSGLFGRLGRDDAGGSGDVPGMVMGGVRAVSPGWDHTLALTEDGTLWAWGRNDYGQLGNGKTGAIFQYTDELEMDPVVYETLRRASWKT